MDFGDFWCKMKLRVCVFCFFCIQHTFVEAKATRTVSEVKSCVFSLSSFQRCRQTWMCVYGTFLHEMCRINTQYRNVQKRIGNTTVGAYTHQISSQSEHYKKGHAEKNIKPRNQITYLRRCQVGTTLLSPFWISFHIYFTWYILKNFWILHTAVIARVIENLPPELLSGNTTIQVRQSGEARGSAG